MGRAERKRKADGQMFEFFFPVSVAGEQEGVLSIVRPHQNSLMLYLINWKYTRVQARRIQAFCCKVVICLLFRDGTYYIFILMFVVATCFTINTDAVGRDNNSQPLKTKTIKQNQDLL